MLDPGGFVVADYSPLHGDVAVGWGGGNYLVVTSAWLANDETFALHAARVSPAGEVLDPAGVLLGQTGFHRTPRAGHLGGHTVHCGVGDRRCARRADDRALLVFDSYDAPAPRVWGRFLSFDDNAPDPAPARRTRGAYVRSGVAARPALGSLPAESDTECGEGAVCSQSEAAEHPDAPRRLEPAPANHAPLHHCTIDCNGC